MKKQYGISIVELLIAFSISAFLAGGIIQIMLSSKQSYRFQDAINEMQASARFSFYFLNKEVRHAAYPREQLVDGFVTADHDILTADGGTTDSDTLVIQYTPENNKDCGGTTLTTATATNAFYLSGTDFVCKGSESSDEFLIAENVQSFQVLYGVDNSTIKDGSADIYVSATRVPDVGEWKHVVAVRTALLFVSSENIAQTNNNSQTYHMLDATALGPFSDRKVRRVFSTTTIVRNQMP